MATDSLLNKGESKFPNHSVGLPKNLDKFLGGVRIRGGAQLASISQHWNMVAKNPLTYSCLSRSWRHGKLMFTHNIGDAVTFHRTPEHLGDTYDRYVQIAVLRTGSITTLQQGKRRVLGANSVMTNLLDQEFFSATSDGLDIILFYVQRDYLESRGIDTALMAGTTMENMPACGSLRALVELAFILQKRHEDTQLGFVERALLELLTGIGTEFTQGFNFNDEASVTTRNQVVNLIDSNYSDPKISVDSIARTLGFSRRHIYRVFEGSKLSIPRLIKSRRVDRAEFLLTLPARKSIAVIASECGFGGPDQLARAFRERHGCSPLEYRAKVDAEVS